MSNLLQPLPHYLPLPFLVSLIVQHQAPQNLLTGTRSCFCRIFFLLLIRELIHYCGLRSLLADIIQPQDLKELCSVLVVVSEEAAQTFAGKLSYWPGLCCTQITDPSYV